MRKLALCGAIVAALGLTACGEGSLVVNDGHDGSPRKVLTWDSDGNVDLQHIQQACAQAGDAVDNWQISNDFDDDGQAAIVTCKDAG